ncbi:MAG: hypothetical protein JO071_15925, partial [Deltaproteobacteria bacterium]|nr:hypothetical protein [Deltaproteobacteria bacterium]
RDLIRVAVVRDPSQAVPISGKWTGAPADFIGMEVDVRVTAHDHAAVTPNKVEPQPNYTTLFGRKTA